MSNQGPIEKRINDAKEKLTSEDLDEMIHEVFSLQASKVNNQGLDEQVASLILNCGDEEAATILEDLVREKNSPKRTLGQQMYDHVMHTLTAKKKP